jgi:uncharacterized protein YjbJ (UPF0337 family)
MNRDELDGKVKEVKGKVKQGIGDLTDDEKLHDEGVADEAEGDAPWRASAFFGEIPGLWRGLDPLRALCYICKVLVGPGTPYLGLDSGASLRARRHSA